MDKLLSLIDDALQWAENTTVQVRHSIRDSKLTFWYELIRPDKILEAAAKEIVEAVRNGTGIPFYYGSAGV